MLLTLGAVRQLCVVGSYLACALARATEAESVAFLFEATAKSVEGAGEFSGRGRHSPIVERIARRHLKHIEENCDRWLSSDLGARWRDQPDTAAAVNALEHVLPACLPGPEGFAAEDLAPARIVAAALRRAAALDRKDPTFAPGGVGYDLLRCLLAHSVAALDQDTGFRELLQLAGLRELLRREREREDADERRHREVLEAIAREKGIDPKVLAPLFEHLGQTGVTPDEMRTRAGEAIEAILARARERVTPSNEGADIDAAIGAARAKLRGLDTAAARSILADKIAEEEAERRRRLIPLLEEQAAIERLMFDYDAAKATLKRLLALDSDRVWGWIDLGDLWVTTGNLGEALPAFRRASQAAERTGGERDLSVSHNKIGDVQVAQGELAAALTSYQADLAIADRLAQADPGNAGWQRDLSVSHNKTGDVQQAQGDLAAALTSYQASLAIRVSNRFES